MKAIPQDLCIEIMEVRDNYFQGWAQGVRVFSGPLQNWILLKSPLRTNNFLLNSLNCQQVWCSFLEHYRDGSREKAWVEDFNDCCALAGGPEILSKYLVPVRFIFFLTVNVWNTKCAMRSTRFLFPQRKKSLKTMIVHLCVIWGSMSAKLSIG